MAQGERRFSTADRTIQKRVFRLAPAGEYDAALLTEKAEIRTSKENPESLPRVSLALELLGTEGDSGKNVLVYTDIYTSLKEGKDGVIMADRGNGVSMLAKALGTVGNFSIMKIKEVDCLNPKEILQWLQNRHGEVIRCRIKVEQNRDRGPQNRVDFFVERPADESTGEVDGETADTETDEFSSPPLEAVPDLDSEEPEMEESQEEELQMAGGIKKQTMSKIAIPKPMPMAVKGKIAAMPPMKKMTLPAKKK